MKWFWRSIGGLVFGLGCAVPTAEVPNLPAPKPTAAASSSVRPVPVFAAPGAQLSAVDACPRDLRPFRQPLAVVNDQPLLRYPPVLGFPIAFPRGANLRSLNGFQAITLEGEALTTQMEVLSRWGAAPDTCGAPVRWGYGFVMGEVSPESRAYLGLEHRPGTNPPSPLALRVQEDADQVVVDTGVARFTLRRDWVTGLSRVEVKREQGWRTVAETPADGSAGFLVTLPGGAPASPLFGKGAKVEVERRGPAVATILIRGQYQPKQGPAFFDLVARFHFYAGTGAVLLEHTHYHGETNTRSAEGAKNLRTAERVYWRLPVSLGGSVAATVRAHEQLHRLTPKAPITLVQDKRSPERPATVYSISHGGERLELGTIADRPLLGLNGQEARAVATIAWLGFREPAALHFDPKAPALEIDFQSEAMAIGGARGIWHKVALDFGAADGTDPVLRGEQLYAHASRPLYAVPNLAYLNTTHAYAALPEAAGAGKFAKLDQDVDQLHKGTVEYLRKYRITGSQQWPDLPRSACTIDGDCKRFEEGYFEGGDDNYWDWSLVELEQFLRTGDPSFVHDFALPEALTMAETISFRPTPGTPWYESSFTGFSPCYGPGRDFEGRWSEGLNHRTGSCPGDYGYNKVHRLAYLLTADRRFLDFFDDGAQTAIRLYGEKPKEKPEEWLELSASRQSAQYVEPLLNAAEFSRRGEAHNQRLLKVATQYFDFMEKNAFERGHACGYAGTGKASPKVATECISIQQWMMPIWADWIARLAYFANLERAKAWLLTWAQVSLRYSAVLDTKGRPDLSAERSQDDDDRKNGWRTAYRCTTGKSGIKDESCRKITDWENGNYYYANGLIAYLNTFGTVAEVDEANTLGLCAWLPEVWGAALARMDASQLNDYVWGKSPGQAYAFAQRALAAVERCLKEPSP
ncbi:MAG: hypothetical protein IPG45_10830 [Deltaproteobacteria bacterium]|nr:hypothetical protein [Deltaproteobacteria bacterium]